MWNCCNVGIVLSERLIFFPWFWQGWILGMTCYFLWTFYTHFSKIISVSREAENHIPYHFGVTLIFFCLWLLLSLFVESFSFLQTTVFFFCSDIFLKAAPGAAELNCWEYWKKMKYMKIVNYINWEIGNLCSF